MGADCVLAEFGKPICIAVALPVVMDVVVQEQWQTLETLLKDMQSLQRNQYKYLGMNYSSDPVNDRIRFEFIFRNSQTVWINFSFYPATKSKHNELSVTLVSPFRRDELVLDQWVARYSHETNVRHFKQFPGDFKQQAKALIKLVDATLSKSGLDAVLAGRTAVDIPSLSLNT